MFVCNDCNIECDSQFLQAKKTKKQRYAFSLLTTHYSQLSGKLRPIQAHSGLYTLALLTLGINIFVNPVTF